MDVCFVTSRATELNCRQCIITLIVASCQIVLVCCQSAFCVYHYLNRPKSALSSCNVWNRHCLHDCPFRNSSAVSSSKKPKAALISPSWWSCQTKLLLCLAPPCPQLTCLSLPSVSFSTFCASFPFIIFSPLPSSIFCLLHPPLSLPAIIYGVWKRIKTSLMYSHTSRHGWHARHPFCGAVVFA